MSALNTDLYELTMAAGYFAAHKHHDVATFELSVRRLPATRNYLVAAGLQQAIEYLLNLRFTPEEIDYLRSLPHFRNASAGFFDYLSKLRFTGDMFAVPEGTPVFPNEPIAIVRAPIIEAQLAETYLISTFAFQTSIASKAARCVHAAQGRTVVEFGSRRAHSPGAGILAGRAAYLAGCAGSSNAEAGMRYGVPVFGTAAHSWTMAFHDEEEAFLALQRLLGDSTVFLIDTYDTLDGARLAARLGKPMWGVRLDSGNLIKLSRQVRQILDDAGLHDAKIFATNDLDEYRLAEFAKEGAPLDAFGVGTQLATSADAPSLSAVYKLVELKHDGHIHYTAKYSLDKNTMPGAKQVYRYPDHDLLTLYTECNDETGDPGEPLLRPVVIQGGLLEPLPTLERSRAYAKQSIAALPKQLHALGPVPPYPVTVSPKLLALTETRRQEFELTRD
jgi:nicotinate phosphoribosyltransferase